MSVERFTVRVETTGTREQVAAELRRALSERFFEVAVIEEPTQLRWVAREHED